MEPHHRLFADYSQYIWSEFLHQPLGECGSPLISCPQKPHYVHFTPGLY